MEVTQFTYFQQAGGKVLEVPAVEITYGLERILMALQVGWLVGCWGGWLIGDLRCVRPLVLYVMRRHQAQCPGMQRCTCSSDQQAACGLVY
jgi:hypothetical protein